MYLYIFSLRVGSFVRVRGKRLFRERWRLPPPPKCFAEFAQVILLIGYKSFKTSTTPLPQYSHFHHTLPLSYSNFSVCLPLWCNSPCQLYHSSVYNGTIILVEWHLHYLPDSLLVSCNFDNGLCFGCSQSREDVFNWTLYSGSTPSSDTGPSSDHTSGSGLTPFEIYPLTFS